MARTWSRLFKCSCMQYSDGPILQLLLYVGHELIGRCAIDHAMLERQRQHNVRPNLNRIVDHDGAFLDSAHSHDRELRLIDNGRADDGAILSRICNRKRSVLYVVRCELFVPSPFPNIIDCLCESEQILL